VKTGRKILISAILSLTAAGAAIAPAVATAAPAVTASAAVHAAPQTHLYGLA